MKTLRFLFREGLKLKRLMFVEAETDTFAFQARPNPHIDAMICGQHD